MGQVPHFAGGGTAGPVTRHNRRVTIGSWLAEGDRALAAGKWDEAREAFERALDDGAPGAALMGLGDALWWLGRTEESLERLEEAFLAYRREADLAGAANAAILLSMVNKANYGNVAVAQGWVRRARRLVEEAGVDSAIGWVHAIEGYVSGDVKAAVGCYEQALVAARDRGDLDLELCALSGKGRALVSQGYVAEGLALIDEAMAGTSGGEWQRFGTVAFTGCDMLVACERVNDLDRAIQWCDGLRRIIANHGSPFHYVQCRMIYGSLLFRQGDWASAEQELRAAAEAGAAAPALHGYALARLAEIEARRGRFSEAIALVESCGDLEAALPRALTALAEGNPERAVALLERRRGKIEDAGAVQVPVLLVEANLARADRDGAARAASELAELAQVSGETWVRGAADLAKGRLALAGGDDVGAVRWLEAACEAFVQARSPFEEAQARRWLAEALGERQGAMAAEEARTALLAFERLGAAPEADATARLLRRLGGGGRPVPRVDGALTEREREVLRLIREGLSNPEIARRLYISRKTASRHVSNVLAKLDLPNRAAAAAHAARLFGD